MDQRITGTGIKNTGDVKESWKQNCTFRMVHDLPKFPVGKKPLTKALMRSGWENNIPDLKLNKLLDRLDEGDNGLLFDSGKEKVLLAACALKLGKTVDWLMNGMGGCDIASWIGIEVGAEGKVIR